MDRTEGAIKSLYHRTLLTLRDELQSQLPAYTDDSAEQSRIESKRG
jgi:hypothetical protein